MITDKVGGSSAKRDVSKQSKEKRLKHKVSGYISQSKQRSIAGCRLLLRTLIIELLETSKNPQISKGVALMPSNNCFCRKRIQFPVAILFSENACLLNPHSWPGWDKHLVNSTAPRGQHVVKCVLNPRYLPPCRGGRGFSWLMHSLFDSITKAFYLR